MNEKGANVSDEPEKDKTFWEKLSDGFGSSFKGVVTFCGGGVIFIAQAIPVLILLGIFLLIGLWGYRKASKRGKKRDEKNKEEGMPSNHQKRL
jgi:hypothetical protein